jgi:predicted lipase
VTIRIVYECGCIIDNPLIVYVYSHSGGIYVQLKIREDIICLYLKLILFLYQYSIPAYREYNPSSLLINPNVQRVVHTVTLSPETVSTYIRMCI